MRGRARQSRIITSVLYHSFGISATSKYTRSHPPSHVSVLIYTRTRSCSICLHCLPTTQKAILPYITIRRTLIVSIARQTFKTLAHLARCNKLNTFWVPDRQHCTANVPNTARFGAITRFRHGRTDARTDGRTNMFFWTSLHNSP